MNEENFGYTEVVPPLATPLRLTSPVLIFSPQLFLYGEAYDVYLGVDLLRSVRMKPARWLTFPKANNVQVQIVPSSVVHVIQAGGEIRSIVSTSAASSAKLIAASLCPPSDLLAAQFHIPRLGFSTFIDLGGVGNGLTAIDALQGRRGAMMVSPMSMPNGTTKSGDSWFPMPTSMLADESIINPSSRLLTANLNNASAIAFTFSSQFVAVAIPQGTVQGFNLNNIFEISARIQAGVQPLFCVGFALLDPNDVAANKALVANTQGLLATNWFVMPHADTVTYASTVTTCQAVVSAFVPNLELSATKRWYAVVGVSDITNLTLSAVSIMAVNGSQGAQTLTNHAAEQKQM